MGTETGRRLDSIFIAVMGTAMAVLFAVAPFVQAKARTGDTVLGQARAYEQACQAITPEEARALNATRRC
jgi:hypothetical protein